MCTVTYIPMENGFVLTSSRDEKVYRPTFSPASHLHGSQNIIYPKDKLAGGTWFAVNGQKETACLLNGGLENHVKKDYYKKSRGKVLLDSFEYDDVAYFIMSYNFEDIEPFTLLVIRKSIFSVIVWDGLTISLKQVDDKKPTIWSSVTLYDRETIQQREKWFARWLQRNSSAPDFNIREFHSYRHDENPVYDILMKRKDGLQTVSITQLIADDQMGVLVYTDLLDRKTFVIDMPHEKGDFFPQHV
ncbi:NRDE family protein [soil metagenome]